MVEAVPTAEQVAAARAFVEAFGMAAPYGGGCEVALRLPEKPYMNATDGWFGVETAVHRLGVELARKMVAIPHPHHRRSVFEYAGRSRFQSGAMAEGGQT